MHILLLHVTMVCKIDGILVEWTDFNQEANWRQRTAEALRAMLKGKTKEASEERIQHKNGSIYI